MKIKFVMKPSKFSYKPLTVKKELLLRFVVKRLKLTYAIREVYVKFVNVDLF